MKKHLPNAKKERRNCLPAILLLLIFCFHFTVQAQELRNVDLKRDADGSLHVVKTGSEDRIPKEYAFSPQIQYDAAGKRITKFVPFGRWDNEEKDIAHISEYAVVTRMSGAGTKTERGAWYYDVGDYQGKKVDLKCTIVDYGNYDVGASTNVTKMGFAAMSEERIGIYFRHLEWIQVKMEYFESNTGTPLPIKSTVVLTDVDQKESLVIYSDAESFMVSEDCPLTWRVEDGKPYFAEEEEKHAYEEDKDHWAKVQVLMDGSALEFRLYSEQGWKLHEARKAQQEGRLEDYLEEEEDLYYMESPYNDGIYVNGPEPPEFMFQLLGISDCRLSPLEMETGTAGMTDSDEVYQKSCTLKNREEVFTCEMVYDMPKEHQRWYYDRMIACLKLPDSLEYRSGAVFTTDGEDVTDEFFHREEDGKVVFDAKQLKTPGCYGKTYRFQVQLAVKEETSLPDFWNGSCYAIPLQWETETECQGKLEIMTSNTAEVHLDREYTDGEVFVVLKDEKSHAVLADGEVTLLEWNQGRKEYLEKELLVYDVLKGGYEIQGLERTYENQGRFKVAETKLPEHYKGSWEMEFEMTKNGEQFTFTGWNAPTGSTKIRMNSTILTGEEMNSQEPVHDTKSNPVQLKKGDRIQYHIYIERDCAKTFKSGELIIKNKIPEGLMYDKDSLNLIGEILHPVEKSTAKIASVRLNSDGTLTWKVNHLDDGEIAHLIFEVSVPEQTAMYQNYSELTEEDTVTRSNLLKHQRLLPELALTLESVPGEEHAVHPRDILTYELTVENIGEIAAKNVIVRMRIPEGTEVIPDSLQSSKDMELHLTEEMVYGILPELSSKESITMKLQVLVIEKDGQMMTDRIEGMGEVKEAGQQEELHQTALEGKDYQTSRRVIHKAENYPDLEPPKENEVIKPNEVPDMVPDETVDETSGKEPEVAPDAAQNQTGDETWKESAAQTGDDAVPEQFLLLGSAGLCVFTAVFIIFHCYRRKMLVRK